MRDGVALVAILARVRRRLRLMAALEGAVIATALALAGVAVCLVAARWRAGATPPHLPRFAIATALAAAALGGCAGALRRISLERCARIVDRALDRAVVSPRVGVGARDRDRAHAHAHAGHDRVLSALAFWRASDGRPPTAFMTAAIADAAGRGAAVAPGVAAPFRRPRTAPALAAAAFLLTAGALSPLPARGSRALAPATTGAAATASASSTPNARVRLDGRALDAEREQAAAALRAASALGDPELDRLARALAATVGDLSGRGLEQSEALDRLSELLRRAEQAADDVAQLSHALEQAGGGLQATAATRDAGRALQAGDGAATERSIEDLAARAAAAGDGARNQIAGSFDRAAAAAAPGAPSSSAATSGDPAARRDDHAAAGINATAGAPVGDPDATEEGESRRRLARDNPTAARPPASSSGSPAGPRATPERRLQRLQRELKETAAACRADPEACRRRLQRQAQELPRMQNEARSLTSRQRLAEAVRQLRDRLRREGGGAGERAREERRFLRSARGENAREPGAGHDEGQRGVARVLTDGAGDPDGVSDEGDDSDGDASDLQMSEGDGAGNGAPDDPGQPGAASNGGGAEQRAAGQGPAGQPGGNGDGIGNQKGDDPLGERGAMTTRGRTREAAVKDGAGPTRSEVIQSAARRGFAHTTYQGVYTDYQAVVEESLDGSAVPPGRRYIVRRYFQLIRPQSPRSSR